MNPLNSPWHPNIQAGKRRILPEIKKRLVGRVMSASISSKRGDIIRYYFHRLAADTTLDAMDGTLEADMLEKIPSDISEMCITFYCLSSENRLLPVGQKSRGVIVLFYGYFLPVETVVSEF